MTTDEPEPEVVICSRCERVHESCECLDLCPVCDRDDCDGHDCPF